MQGRCCGSGRLVVLELRFCLVFGVLVGLVASLKRNPLVDYSAMIFAELGLSVPSFVLAYLLQYVFALKLNMLPVAGWEGFPTRSRPAGSLGMIVMAAQSRLMRSSMLETLQQDYIKTAKAKGLSPFQITFRHQIRNAILPVVVYTGPLFAIITTGSFVIESIFGIPGLGQFFVNSVRELDYTVIMGITVFYAGYYIACLLLIDLFYCVIDPRIRLAS